ncbi:MAG: alpha/beta-hydrolase family protein [Chloroflexi bacterium]|nr:alpha/beta-hydrolase family protein [Chloroflexota bacterium]
MWLPVFDNGRSVRFVNRDPRQPALDPQWRVPRIAYLQHPSDPATYWGVAALWWPPEWLDYPRGYDVPDAARWFPIVSGVQAVADLIDTDRLEEFLHGTQPEP